MITVTIKRHMRNIRHVVHKIANMLHNNITPCMRSYASSLSGSHITTDYKF